MDENRKKDLSIFFTAVAFVAVTLVGGIAYFKSEAAPGNLANSLPADIATNVPIGPAPATAIPVPSSTAPIGSSQPVTVSTLAPVPPKKLPYLTSTFLTADWLKDWGLVSPGNDTNNGLTVGASSSTTGGSTFLIGSDAWANYDFEADVDWVSGETASIVARETNISNFVYCDFGPGEATIIERTANVDTVIGSNESPNGGPGVTYQFGIRVYGNEVACMVNNQEVAAAVMETGAPSAGGIGFLSWDHATDTSEMILKSIKINALKANNIIVPFPALIPSPPPVAPVAIITTTTTATLPPIAPTSTPIITTPPTPTLPIALTIPYNELNFSTDTNWHANWGTSAIDPSSNALIVESTSTTSGATVLLENSTAWTNYEFDANMNWVKGETFGLIARYINDKNYTVCEFDQLDPGDVQLTLEQYVNGQENELAQGSIANYRPSATFVDGYIRVYNTEGVCSLDGHQISNNAPNSYLINAPFNGGIGFTMWDPATDNTEMVVSSVSVQPAYN